LFSGQEIDQMQIFEHADVAMYEAKEFGRNYSVFFNSGAQQGSHKGILPVRWHAGGGDVLWEEGRERY
jgi:hypothetical protein